MSTWGESRPTGGLTGSKRSSVQRSLECPRVRSSFYLKKSVCPVRPRLFSLVYKRLLCGSQVRSFSLSDPFSGDM